MTEEDTFRKLAQRPFEEVRSQLLTEHFAQLSGSYGPIETYGNMGRALILKTCGWTEKEYEDACRALDPTLYYYITI